jgi:hypothetical protein
MAENSVRFPDETAAYIVDTVSTEDEPGVRSLDQAVISIVNKVSFLKNHQDRRGNLPGFSMSFDQNKKLKFPLRVTKTMVDSFLLQSPRMRPLEN